MISNTLIHRNIYVRGKKCYEEKVVQKKFAEKSGHKARSGQRLERSEGVCQSVVKCIAGNSRQLEDGNKFLILM